MQLQEEIKKSSERKNMMSKEEDFLSAELEIVPAGKQETVVWITA